MEVFQQKNNEKKGKFTLPKPIFSINRFEISVTVPGKEGRQLTVSIEDLRPEILHEIFAQKV